MAMKMKKRWIPVVMALGLNVAAVPGAVAQSAAITAGVPGDADAQIRQEGALREAARRTELTVSILAAREVASGRRFSAALRLSLAAKLERADPAALEAFANAGGLGNIDALNPTALGDAAADLVFTPVTPCRIINTVATSTPLAANTNRAFYVNGNTAAVFEAQGGNAGGCGIPDAATAVEMNFIAVAPAAAGDFRAFPWSATPTPPLASVINYANVPGLNIANGLAQPVCNAATTTCNFDLIVQADAGQSHLIIDVVGYYSAPPSAVTVLRYSGSTIDATITSTSEEFRVVGNFTKVSASSGITTTWNAHINTVGTVGTSFCHYQVRIDGLNPVGPGLPGPANYGDHQVVAWTDHWTGLTAGTHAVTIWVRGSATSCNANFGNFQQSVVVKEQ